MAALTAVLRGLVEEHVALGRKNDAPWRFDPHAEDDLAFMWASYVGGKNGDDEAVVRFYLADEKTSRSSVQQAMVMSAGGGNVRCFDLLRKSVAERESAGEDELGECLGMALRFAAREGRPQMVALILDLLVDLGEIAPDNDSTAHPQPHIGLLTPTLLRLSLASPDVVRVLLTRTPLRPDVETFVAACLKGFTPTVALMLDSDPRLASAQDSRALRVACSSGHADIAALLIRSSSKCDPSARDDEAVRYACNNGHVDVVRLLLADGRVDPRARNDECLARALANGHEDVVSLLRGCGCRVGIGSSMAYFGRRVSTEVGGMWRGWKFASLHASSSGLVTAAVANRVVRAGVVEGWNHAGEAMWWFLYPVMVLLVWALCSLALRH
ncbi:hypothetical protein HK101_001151 [Irineochytrium annulatum]|nr:hypothetical protein HK101_001151 [Irineochytrium annulatum]